MPTIPMYQSQVVPSGSRSVAPSPAGGFEGRSVQNLAGAVGKIADVGTDVSRRRIAEDEKFRQQAEARRLEDIDFANRSWASRTFAEAQLASVNAINEAQRNRQQGQITSSTAIRQQGETWTETALKAAPSEDARRYAEQNIRTTWASAERTAVENDDQYRTQWGVRQFEDANDSQQIAIQDAPPNMVDGAFVAAAHNIGSTLSGLSLDPETKAKLGEKMLSESVIRSGTRIIQAEGPDKFLDLINGVHREGAGKKKVSRPGNGRWAVEIQQAAEATGVDPALIEAVMNVESGGNIGAPSSKGAIGLMQLMPDTAQELGVDPARPEENVLGGAKYLGQLLKKYGGDEDKALAAYNAGMGKVDKAGGVPNFKETKEYVAKVKAERNRFKSAQEEQRISASQIPAWWQAATADDRDRLVGTALRMQQELAASNLQFLGTWKQNADAAQSNGLPVPGSPSRQTVLAAFAGDETKANAWYQQNAKPFDDIRNLSASMGSLTIAEMDQQIAAITPKAGRANDPNLAADMARVHAAENAKRNILEQRSRDPMAQAFQQPAVRHLAGDPEKQMAAAVAWQKANVPEGKRSVLFDDDRQKLADAWMNPQATGGGIQVLEQMRTKYGSHFDDALVEIAPKAPSDALLYVGMNTDQKTAPARSRMRMLASKTLDEVVAGNEAKKKQATDAVGKSFAPFFASFKQTNSIEGAKYIENIRPAVIKYAVSYMNEGLDPGRAAQRAFDDVVRSQYDFLDGGRAPDGRAQVRIPRAMGDDKLVRSYLEDGLDETINKAPKELAFPKGISRADGLDAAYWATSANDRGAVLMYKGAPVRVVHEGKLVPFELSWNAIANAGQRYQQER